MQGNGNITDRIDAYLSGHLSKQEIASFELEMDNNAILKSEVDIQKTINQAVIDSSILDFSDAFSTERIKQKKSRRLKRTLITASGALIVVSTLTFLLWLWKENSQTTITSWPDAATKDFTVDVESLKSDKIKLEEQSTSLKSQDLIDNNTEANHHLHNFIVTTKFPTNKVENLNNQSISTDEVITFTPTENHDIMTDNTIQSRTIIPSDTSIKKNEATIPTTKSSCEDVNITAQVNSHASCRDEYNGEIEFTKVTGGQAPYIFENINSKTGIQEEHTFSALGGNLEYNIKITDNNGCSVQIAPIFIEEQSCFTPEPGFNPDFETWKYHLDSDEEATIKIRNKAGQIILERTFLSTFEWDGSDESGKKVPLAAYRFIITAKNIKPKSGSVSVIY